MSSSHTKNNKGGNGKTKAEPAQQIMDLQNKIDFLTDELRRKDEQLEDLKSGKDNEFIVKDVLWVSEAWFNEVFDNHSDSFMIIDSKWRLMYVNDAVVKVAGKSKEQLIGQVIGELWPQFIGSVQYEMVTKIMDDKTPRTWISRSTVGDKWHEYRAFPWENGVAFFARDITERKMVEEAVQTNLQRFHTILSGLSAAILLVTNEDRIEFTNQEFCDYFHLNDTTSELMGLGTSEMIAKIKDAYLNPDEAVARIMEIVRHDKPVRGEEVAMKGRTCLRDYIPIYMDGKLHGRLWLHLDITKRKRAEEASRKSEEQFRKLFMSVNEGFYIADILYDDNGRPFDYRYVEVNPEFEKMMGLSRDQIIGKRFRELVPNYSSEWMGIFNRVARTGIPVKQVFYSEAFDRHFETIAYRTNEDRLAVLLSDITERKRAEERIAYQSDLLANITDVVYSTDAKLHILSWNHAAEKVYGWTEEEVFGKNVVEVTGSTFDPKKWEELTNKLMETGSVTSEIKHTTRFGEHIIFESKTMPLHDVGGKISGFVSVNRDITERKKAEEALREREEKYRSLFNNMTEGFALHKIVRDKHGVPVDYRFLEVNPAFEKLTGLKRSGILGRRMNEVLPGNDPVWVKKYGEVALTGIPSYFENYSPPLNRHYEVYAYRPAPSQFATIFTDITERKLAQDAIRKSEERLRLAGRAGRIGLYEWNIGRGDVYWSPETYELFGCDPKAPANSETWMACIHPDDREHVTRSMAEVQASDSVGPNGVSKRDEYRVIHSDGTVHWLGATSVFYHDGGDLVIRGSVSDITERKQAEEIIRKNDGQFRVLIHNLKSGVALVDESGKFSIVNPAFLRMFGLDDELSILNVNSQDWVKWQVLDANGNLLDVNDHPVRKAAVTGKAVKDQLVCVRNPGSIELTWMLITAEPIIRDDGRLEMLVCTYLDITDIKRAEDGLKTAKQQAEMYLDLMGHDISNIHQIAMGQLELAQDIINTDGKLEGENIEMIDTSLQSLWRSAKLIDNVRKLQKIRSNEVKNIEISLDDVLAGSIKQYDGLYPDTSITVDHGEGPHIVKANELLRDVFTNLIGNAIKHSNGTRVDIQVKLEDMLDNGRKFFKISIEDNGPGITDDMKDRIFNRLQRGETQARGMGLGLYLVKSLVDSYSGKVWVEDRILGDHTKGSRFVVVLPAIE